MDIHNKIPILTDRGWNNSELKKFSVTQSKSNADIENELRAFRQTSRVENDAAV